MGHRTSTGRRVCVRVPAKVNLELTVGPPREDGYHNLATVFHAVGLYDEVCVEESDRWSVEVSGPYADGVPRGGSNLAVKAARLMGGTAEIATPMRIAIDKQIPVQGGMAGGSADAAAALLACDALWELGMGRQELERYAARLGSDVPFLLSGGTAIGSGRGENLAPVLANGTYQWVFALSPVGLSTPAVYAECDRLRGDAVVPEPTPAEELMAALRSGEADALGAALTNDLQEAAFSLRPELREVYALGIHAGALGGIVSGSGPTIAFLCADAEGALDLAVALAASGEVPEIKRALGPTHGAHVVPAAVASI